MEEKETLFKTDIGLTLAQDEDYFRNIFKKTEKIACAVFYITRSVKDSRQDDRILTDIEETAKRLIDVSVKALSASQGMRLGAVNAVRYTHIELESRLRVMSAAGMLPREHLEVFLGEIDTVQRSLNKFLTATSDRAFFGVASTGSAYVPTPSKRVLQRLGERREKRTTTQSEGMPLIDRRERVIAVLRDKGEATIKDISTVVTNCSEKTIQRELNALIKDAMIVREGERRWSKYKLVQ